MTTTERAFGTAGALAFVALTACSSEATAPTPVTSSVTSSVTSVVTAGDPLSVIVDYSPTTSDVDALLFLAANQRVDLLAVTLAGTGESRCEVGVSNTRALLALVGRPDVPVACGRTQPLGPGHEWPTEWRDAADALAGLDLAASGTTTAAGDGTDDAAELLAGIGVDNSHVVVIALGPLTNLAEAIERHPELLAHVAMVYSMGGALDVAGNAPNGKAEWNFYIDPTAVATVVDSGLPLTVVPLDATNDVPVESAWFDRLAEQHRTPAANAVHELFSATHPWETGLYFWDELTAAIAVDESLATFHDARLGITTEGPDAGRITDDVMGADVRVAATPDVARFESTLLAGLNGAPAAMPG